MRSWSALHRPVEPVVVVSTGGGTVRIWQVTDAQAPLSLPVWTLKAQLAQDASACAAGSEFSGLGGQLRPRRDCAPFADPTAVVVREDGRASTRVAEPLALPQEAVPKWFVPGPEILQLARS